MHMLQKKHRFTALALATALMASSAAAVAQRPGDRPGGDRPDGNRPGGNRPGQSGPQQSGRPHGPGGRPGGRPDFHFQQSNRDQFNKHYRNDAMRWRNNGRRPAFTPGYVIPRNYAIRPVPRSYWQGQPPPPPGYQYGYYDGYVVAYNPTTRIIADVMDLVAGLAN